MLLLLYWISEAALVGAWTAGLAPWYALRAGGLATVRVWR